MVKVLRVEKAEIVSILTSFSAKSLALICTLLIATACTGPNHTFDWRKPALLNMNPPEGPHEYQQGWVDGCKSGIASTNTNLHMTLGSYVFTLDPELRYERLYNTAWRYAYNHCGYSMKTMARYQF